MKAMWQPEKELVDGTAKKRDEILCELSEEIDPRDSKRYPKVLELFKVLGMRHVMGLEETLTSDLREKIISLVPLALAYLKPEQVLAAAENIVLRAPELLLLEDEALTKLEDELEQDLKTRDRVELVLIGARSVLGCDPELPLELETAILTFEGLLKEELWRLLPLGSRRAAAIVWAKPEMRQRFWWWALGEDLPQTALEDLSTSARIIHLFPKARQELESMIVAEKFFEFSEAGREKISLREFFLKTRYENLCQKKRQEGIFKLAADVGEEIVLLREPEDSPKITLSSDGRKILLDIEPPHRLRGGEKPVLEIPGREKKEFTPTERGRYELLLDEEIFKAPAGKILVLLETEDVFLEVPFKK